MPQGSILGPILFLIYLHDLPSHPKTKLTIFADDTSIRSMDSSIQKSSTNVNDHLTVLQPYYDKWKIRVNANKSESIIFTRRRKTENDIPTVLIINGAAIPSKTTVKYLGVTFQKNLKFNDHVSNVIRKAKEVTSKLWTMMGPNSKLHKDNKLLMYKLYIRSVLTYNIQVWDDVSRSSMQRIQVLQNKSIRAALNLRPHPITFKQVHTSTIHLMTKIPLVSEFACKIKDKFVNNCNIHQNVLIRSLFRNGNE